jgi:hypothetical protein
MKNHWRKLFAFLPESIERKAFKSHFTKEHLKLQQNNSLGIASNLTKQEVLKQLRQQYHLTTVVETGTYLGDTLFALYPYFDKLYSIELSEYYHNKARRRFKNHSKINLVHGDSGQQLRTLVNQLSSPALFWLDGHYSGGLTAKGDKECPVFEELNAIFSSPLLHVIVIDDARLFVGENDYPTIDELKEYLAKHRNDYALTVETDSIRLLPRKLEK